MPDTAEAAVPQEDRKPWLWTSETARAASLKWREEQRANGDAKALDDYRPSLPDVSDEAARALLPRILSDEITFRSELLATVRRGELALLDALNRQVYDASKTTLTGIVNSLCKVVELSERIVDKTKGLDLTGTSSSQVSGLFAKAVLLRGELVRMGIMDQEGNFKRRPGDSQTSPEGSGSTIGGQTIPEHGSAGDRAPDAAGGGQTVVDEAGAVADSPPRDEEGVL